MIVALAAALYHSLTSLYRQKRASRLKSSRRYLNRLRQPRQRPIELFSILRAVMKGVDMQDREQKEKCAQASCNCKATAGEYCSEQCRNAAEGQTECNCGHADC